jgi:hypothetical protein
MGMKTDKTRWLLTLCLLTLTGDALARGPWRASEHNTKGWHFMSPKERIEHQATVRAFKAYEPCHDYQVAHHQQMQARASAKGLSLPAGGRDICEHLRTDTVGR